MDVRGSEVCEEGGYVRRGVCTKLHYLHCPAHIII